MLVYHGSRDRFNRFDARKIGKNGTKEGKGFYFTDQKRIARGYGENGFVYSVEFQGKKQLHPEKLTITKTQLRKLLLELNNQTDYLSNWGEVAYEGINRVLERAVHEEMATVENDVDLIGALCNASGDTPLVLELVYQLLGFDSIVQAADWGGEQTIYIALTQDVIQIQHVEKWQEATLP